MKPKTKTRTQVKYLPPKVHTQAFYNITGRRPRRVGYWERALVTKETNAHVSESEVIHGWVGSKRAFHPCFHEKTSYSWSPVSYSLGPAPGGSLQAVIDLSNDAYSIYAKGHLVQNNPDFAGSLIPGRPPIREPRLDWPKALESLLDDANGLMPSQKSIAVNLAEFKQLKRLVPSISKPISNILRWVSGQPNGKIKVFYRRPRKGMAKRYFRTVDVRSMRWTLRDLSQLHLAHSFGVAPLAEDLGELAAKLWEVKIHTQWWKSMTDGNAHTVRSRVSDYQSWNNPLITSGRYLVTEKVENSTIGVLGAHMRIRPVTEEVAQMRLFQQIIGWNVPLQIAWELVPFSFVVDWFLPVGELLNRFEPKRFFGSLSAGVTILDRWHSVKTVATTERIFEPGDQSYASKAPVRNPMPENLMFVREHGGGKCTYTSYSRNALWPSFRFVLPKGVYKLKQAGLSLSLVVARLFRR